MTSTTTPTTEPAAVHPEPLDQARDRRSEAAPAAERSRGTTPTPIALPGPPPHRVKIPDVTLLRPGRLLFALPALAALAVAVTGSLLLWRYREATLAAAAEREAVVVSARAYALADEMTALVAEVGRLSRLAEVDLADGNLEPEKTVLRLARRDSAVFSVAIAILDSEGEVLWAEPREARPGAPGAALVGLARGRGRPAIRYADHEIDVAAPVAGQGAIVAMVHGAARDLFGPELRRALREGGEIALTVPLGREDDVVVAALRTGDAPPPLALPSPGQAWVEDAHGRRWLVTEASVADTGLVLRLVLSAREVEGALTGPFWRLVALVGALTALSVGAALALALLARRLERAELEVARSRELAAMGKTSAAIAHEVKNALNGLSVAVDVLAGGKADGAIAASVQGRARAEIARLRDVAEDLTLFAATPRLVLAEVDLGGIVRRARDAVLELAEDCGVDVRLDVPDAPLPLRADGPKLLGAVANLARNGIEAMGPGAFGERLDDDAPARERRLELGVRRERGRAVVEVADRGAGLVPEVRAHLFEPFVTTKRTGTGLGLAIVRKVVTAHGGVVEAADRPGGGTVFRVVLPLEEVAA